MGLGYDVQPPKRLHFFILHLVLSLLPMRKKNLIVALIAFVMCLIAVYFGASIYNANENALLEHLNERDNLNYYDVEAVPALSKIAAIITLPFILAIFVFQIIIVLKTNSLVVKNIARGIIIAMILLICVDVATISNPIYFDFSKWGFFWITFGLITVWGNLFSVFVKEN